MIINNDISNHLIKKNFLFILLISIFVFPLFAENRDFYEGNEKDNITITHGEMYLVIHNPIERSYTVMSNAAKKYCSETSGNNFSSWFMQPLDKYSAYFSCQMIDQYYEFNLSSEIKTCIENRSYQVELSEDCFDQSEKYSEIYQAIEKQNKLEEKYKSFDFIYSIRSEIYNEMKNLEELAEKKIIEEKKDLCKNFGFNSGSKSFNECLLILIQLGEYE